MLLAGTGLAAGTLSKGNPLLRIGQHRKTPIPPSPGPRPGRVAVVTASFTGCSAVRPGLPQLSRDEPPAT
jgi:hypothetical protein